VTPIDEDNAVRNLACKAHFMGDHHHRHALIGQRPHDRQYFTNELWVECRSWLIKEDRARLHRQCAGDGDPLLLAS